MKGFFNTLWKGTRKFFEGIWFVIKPLSLLLLSIIGILVKIVFNGIFYGGIFMCYMFMVTGSFVASCIKRHSDKDSDNKEKHISPFDQ